MMACLQLLFVLYGVAISLADRDASANSELAVQSSAAFSQANASIEKGSSLHVRHRPSSSLQKTFRGYHHHHHRDHRMPPIDDQLPPEPLDARPSPFHGHSELAHSQPIDEVPEEFASREPVDYDREGEGLQAFSRSRGQEDALALSAEEDRARARKYATALAAVGDNDESLEIDGQHDTYKRDRESHGSAEDNDVEDVQPRAEQEAHGGLNVHSDENIPRKIVQQSRESHALAQEDPVQAVVPRKRVENSKSLEETQPFHLAHQSSTVSSEEPQVADKNMQMKQRPAPHFGSIDLNGDGFIDGLEFQAAMSRGDLR
jgi:hypothetical protein